MKDVIASVLPFLGGLLIFVHFWAGGRLNYCQAYPEKFPYSQNIESAENPNSSSSLNNTLDRIGNELLEQKLSKDSLNQAIAAVKSNPHNYRTHIVLGNCCDTLGLPEEAMKQYKLAYENGPNQPQAFIELIKALVKSGQSIAASNLLKQAIKRFPTNGQILLWTGNTLYDEHKYKEAESLYLLGLGASQQPVLGLSTALARLRLKDKRYDAALNLCHTDLSLNPNFPQANEIAGIALMETGKFAKAMPCLKIAFRTHPYDYLISFDYTQSLIWCGKYNDALLPALCSLATAGTDQNKQLVQKTISAIVPHLSTNGLRHTTSQLENYPPLKNNPAIHIELAKIAKSKDLADLATSEFLTAVKLDPQSWTAKYQAALVLEAYEHNYALALQYLRDAHGLNPNNDEITQHLMRLEDRLTNRTADWAWQIKDGLSLRSTH